MTLNDFRKRKMCIIVIQIRPFLVREAARRHGANLMRGGSGVVAFGQHGVRTGSGGVAGIWMVSAGSEKSCGIFLGRGGQRTGFARYAVAA